MPQASEYPTLKIRVFALSVQGWGEALNVQKKQQGGFGHDSARLAAVLKP
jgi:hypothetical protein